MTIWATSTTITEHRVIDMQQFVSNKNVVIDNIYFERYTTGIEGLDRLFENGIMPSSVVTVCGRQGSGKTQLMLQLSLHFQ